MTKKELIELLQSVKFDMQIVKRELEFRKKGNNVDFIVEKYKDDDNKYAYMTGTFQAMVEMSNQSMERAIEKLNSVQTELESV